MAKEIRKNKFSFGGCSVQDMGLPAGMAWPEGKAINMNLTFDEALKLSLGLQAVLLEINSFNKATKEGKAAGVDLCVFASQNRITVTLAKLK